MVEATGWSGGFIGAAGRLAKAATATFGVALAFFFGYVVLVLARPGDWTALLFFGWGLVVVAFGIFLLAMAVTAAAFRFGRMPQWTLALGLVVFLGTATLSVMSLAQTGSPTLVGSAAVFSILGILAGAVAWVRLRRERAPAA